MLHVFTTHGRLGASSRVRVWQWLERVPVEHELHDYAGTQDASPWSLSTHPVATVTGEYAARWTRRIVSDTVLVHRGATPFSKGEVETRLLRSSTLGIYDFDDAIQWEAANGRLGRRLFPPALRAIASVQAADRVIAGNAMLADWASASAPDVRVIPSCVEPSLYRRKRHYAVADPPVIGWIGSASTEPYLEAVAPALREVHSRTGAVLVVIGAVADRPGPLNGMMTRVPWTESRAHNHAADWDVGIMPLQDRLYDRGKCGYKLLQYGAAGLPMVGSPVGVNAEILASMGAPAPSNSDEWVDALVATIEAPSSTRSAWGAQARRVVERNFSYAAWEGPWRDAVGLSRSKSSTRDCNASGVPR